MSNWLPHTRGDLWRGQVWIYTHPETGEPFDLTGHIFAIQFRPTPESEEVSWELSTEGQTPGLVLDYGDGSILTLPCGRKFTFAPRDIPYGLRVVRVVPPLGVGTVYADLEHTYPGDPGPTTEDKWTWTITQDSTRLGGSGEG